MFKNLGKGGEGIKSAKGSGGETIKTIMWHGGKVGKLRRGKNQFKRKKVKKKARKACINDVKEMQERKKTWKREKWPEIGLGEMVEIN